MLYYFNLKSSPFCMGCGTWSLALREEHRLRAFEKNIWSEERVEVSGDWRRLHNEELHNLYSS
jgi:hypothetical protein